MTKEPTQRPQRCLEDVVSYDWDSIYSDLASSKWSRIAFLLGRYKSFIIVVEAEPLGLDYCLQPQVYYIASCNEKEQVDDPILSVAAIADEMTYEKGCFYIIFRLRGPLELLRVHRIVSSKLGIKGDIALLGHWVVEDG